MKPSGLPHCYPSILTLFKKTVVNEQRIRLCNSSTALVFAEVFIKHVQGSVFQRDGLVSAKTAQFNLSALNWRFWIIISWRSSEVSLRLCPFCSGRLNESHCQSVYSKRFKYNIVDDPCYFFLFAGEESTLFVVLFMENFPIRFEEVGELLMSTRECLKEKFALISNTKLVISSKAWSSWDDEELPQETLEVRLNEGRERKLTLAMILELLNSRWQTLDLISVFREVQRTLSIKTNQHETFYSEHSNFHCNTFDILENLSCLPKLQKTE